MKKKVVFFAKVMQTGGVASVLVHLLDSLKNYNDIEIYVFGDCLEKRFCDFFAANLDTIKHSNKFRFRSSIFYRILNWSSYKKMKRERKKLLAEADVVIDFRNGQSYNQIKQFKGKKIVWLHGGFEWFINSPTFSDAMKFDKIVCLSESFKDDFIRAFPMYANKIEWVYNLMPVDKTAKKSQKFYAPDGKYFVSVARIEPDKDYATLLLAFNKFWNDNKKPDVKLQIVGDGVLTNRMKSLAAALPAHENIVFAGKIPEPFGYMRGSMANILSSQQEGLPTVILEAMASGTLCISSDCKSSPREMLMNGEAGLLYPAGDYEKLAKIMSDVYKQKVPRDKIIKTATSGLARFSDDEVIPKVLEIIHTA